jgi:hypothetical protein
LTFSGEALGCFQFIERTRKFREELHDVPRQLGKGRITLSDPAPAIDGRRRRFPKAGFTGSSDAVRASSASRNRNRAVRSESRSRSAPSQPPWPASSRAEITVAHEAPGCYREPAHGEVCGGKIIIPAHEKRRKA